MRRALLAVLTSSALAVLVVAPSRASAKPPWPCTESMGRVYMQFGYDEPTYYMPNVFATLRSCRRADWLAAAWLEMSRSTTMDDYNYNRVPGVALSGKDLASLLKWMCAAGNKARREGRLSLQPHLACGETSRTNLKKFAPSTTTTTTTTSDPTPRRAVVESVDLEVREYGYGLCQRVSCGNGSTLTYVRVIGVFPRIREYNNPVTRICVRLDNKSYDGTGYEVPTSTGRDCFERNELLKTGTFSLSMIFDETLLDRSPLKSECPKPPLGFLTLCKTLNFSLSVITERLEPVQADFKIYIKHGPDGLFYSERP